MDDDDDNNNEEIINKYLIITDSPYKWNNKKKYDVFTLDSIYINRKKNPEMKYTYVLIDETLTMDEIKMYADSYRFDLYAEIMNKYMKEYSILIKPQKLYHDNKNKLYLLGVFRFKTRVVYNIYSKFEFVELHKLFKDNYNIIAFKSEIDPNILLKEINEEKLKLAKEQRYAEMHQKKVEIKIEILKSVHDYNIFIKNRVIFSKFIAPGITNISKLKDTINKSKNFPYSNDIFTKISEKYGNEFPYDVDYPLSIYYVIIIHSNILKDKLYDSYKDRIASNIGKFANRKINGIVIQSVMFTPIPYYDPVEMLKIHNNDFYYIWMKPELSDEGNIYESHIKSFQFIKNNLKKKVKTGGTQKLIKKNMKSKTYSNKII